MKLHSEAKAKICFICKEKHLPDYSWGCELSSSSSHEAAWKLSPCVKMCLRLRKGGSKAKHTFCLYHRRHHPGRLKSRSQHIAHTSFSTFYVNQAENPRLTRFQWRVDHLALFAIVINVLVKTVLLMSASVKPWEGMGLSPAEYRKVLGAAKWREKNPFCNSYKSFRELRAKKR